MMFVHVYWISGSRAGEGTKVLARADGRVCVPGVRSCAGCRVVDHSGVSSERSTGRATF